MKKCPFCGGEPVLHHCYGKYGYFYYVQCSTCQAQSKTATQYYKGEYGDDDNWDEDLGANRVIYFWNMRAGE